MKKIFLFVVFCLAVPLAANASYFSGSSGGATSEVGLETILTDVTDVFTNNDGALDDDDVTDDNVESMATAGAVGFAPVSDGASGLTMTDVWTEAENTTAAYLSAETDPNALLSGGTDNVKDTHVDWGAGVGQVDLDDVPDSATYGKTTVTQVGYIDQDVGSGSSPTLDGTNFSGIPAAALPDAAADGATKGVSTFNATRFSAALGVVDIASVAGLTGANEDDVTNDNVESMATAGAVGLAPLSDGASGLTMTDILTEVELDTFSELNTQIADKTLVNEEDAVEWDNLQVIDVTNDKAFVVRVNGDGGDAFSVDTNGTVGIIIGDTDGNYSLIDSNEWTVYNNQNAFLQGTGTNFSIRTNTSEDRINLDNTETVFNEDSNDRNFRVETNANANAFVIDAGAETATFAVPVTVNANIVLQNGEILDNSVDTILELRSAAASEFRIEAAAAQQAKLTLAAQAGGTGAVWQFYVHHTNENLYLTNDSYGTVMAHDDLAGTTEFYGQLQVYDPDGTALLVQNQTNAASNEVAVFRGGNRTSAANNDEAYISFYLDDDTEVQAEFGRITWIATDVQTASQDAAVEFELMVDDVSTVGLTLTGSSAVFAGTVRGAFVSSDASVGVTGASCSSFKDGICVAT